MVMKKSGLFYLLSLLMIAACGGCSNVCQDPHSGNFNQAGKCIDVASNVTGTYSGTLCDSSASGARYYTVVLKMTKINNTNISVQLSSPSGTPFTAFDASVAAVGNEYYLSVTNDGNVSGAAAIYGTVADGIYRPNGRQLFFYTKTVSGTFESFAGTMQ
jgi:hypothetical protein